MNMEQVLEVMVQMQKDFQERLEAQMLRSQQELRDQMLRVHHESQSQLVKLMEQIKGHKEGQSIEGTPDPEAERSKESGSKNNHPPKGDKENTVRFKDPQTSPEARVPNLNDPKELEKLRAHFSPQSETIHDESYKLIDERLRAIEGNTSFGKVDMNELSLVLDLILPRKFKMPDFDKYDGSKCPKAHIQMYCQSMTGYGSNDKLLIHCFQASLLGAARRWYNQLGQEEIQSWKQLAHAFLEHYKHVTDLGPDRMTLQSMNMGPEESFRQYAQRWRDLASQVQPPLTGRELTIMFIDTLQDPFYDNLVGNASRDFSDLIMAGEMIEKAVKAGRL